MAIWFRIKKSLDSLLEALVAMAMGVLVLDVTWQVASRYVFRSPSIWTDELATFLLIWVGLLGASVALNRGAHLGIDYFALQLSPRNRLVTELVVFATVALFSLLVLIYGGGVLVYKTLQLGQTSPAMGLKMGYVYLALPISGFFLTLYSIEFFVERLLRLMRGEIEPPTDPDTTADGGLPASPGDASHKGLE